MQTQLTPENDKILSNSPTPPDPYALDGEPATEIDFLEVSKTLREHRNQILLFALVPTVLTAIVTLLMRPTYTGVATFLPPNSMSANSPLAALGQLGALGATGGALGGLKDPTLIYIGILNSRAVAEDLINQFNLANVYKTKRFSQTQSALKSRTQIVSGKDSIVSVSVEDHDPRRAADMANAYLTSLHKLNDRIVITEAGQKRLFFEQQLSQEKDALADAEVELTKVQEKTGLIQPGGQAQLEIATIAQTQAEIASREVQLAAMGQGATEQNADVIRVRSEVAGLRRQLSRLENTKTKGRAGDIQVPTSKVPELTLIYVRKAREVKFHEALYELLLRQYESAKLEESRSSPLIQVVDFATPPDSKSGPKRTILSLSSGFIGGFIGIVQALLRSAFKRRKASTTLSPGESA